MTADQKSNHISQDSNQDPTNLPPRLLRIEEVADILQISRSHCYQLVQRQEMPSVRIGRSVRVRPVDLEAFIESSVCTFNRW